MRHVVKGIKDIWELNVIHRDMKLANIVLNFPDNPEMIKMNRTDKKKFLQTVDFTKVNFTAKIADFGLSTILDEST
jgi:serine/threonine protein kinase